MDVIWTILIGFIIGFLAKFVMPGDNKPRGFVLTTLLGIAGAFVGTFLGQFVGYLQPGEQGNVVVSIIGAVVVLLLWRWIAKRRPA
jgi:uncharacterized membrane protein YeaQ/YmgE (transglycosylase-associated protein family)